MQAAILKITFLLLVLTVLQTDGWWWSRRRRRSSPPPDTEDPRFTYCPSDRRVNTEYRRSSVVVSYSTPEATDNKGISSISRIQGDRSGTRFSFGSHSIRYKAIDAAGNTAYCSFSITVNDNENPRFTYCPSDIRVNTEHRQSSAVVSYTTPRVTDNTEISSVRRVLGVISGTRFVFGSYNIQYRASDGAGNTAYCSFSITVNDNEAPRWTYCPSNIRVYTDHQQQSAAVNYTTPTATDNGRINSVSRIEGDNSGTRLSLGSHSIRYRASDTAGNTVYCAFSITVNDNEAPRFMYCPANIRVSNENQRTSAIVRYTTPRATDNVRVSTVSRITGIISGTRLSNGSSSVQYRATDGAGNVATCTFSIMVYVVSCSSIPSQTGRSSFCPHGVLKGAICSFSCTIGYHLRGQSSITCSTNGEWNTEHPSCILVTCSLSDLSTPDNGFISGCSEFSVNHRDTCTLSCNHGYRPTSPTQSTCQDHGEAEGSWSPRSIVCTLVTCSLSDLPTPDNGFIGGCNGSSVNHRDTCTLSCNHGYSPTSPTHSTCQDHGEAEGSWSTSLIACTPVQCMALRNPSHGSITSCTNGDVSRTVTQLQYVDYQCIIECNYGYTAISGSRVRLCQTDGEWSGSATVCVAIQCDLPTLTDGSINGCSGANVSYQKSCQFICDIGFRSHDGQSRETRICQANGSFSDQSFNCLAIQCDLPTLTHGSINGCSGATVSYQESCQFVCDIGFRSPDGQAKETRICQANGSFSDQSFNCSAIQCDLPTLTHGSINGCSGATVSYQESCQFVCDIGFRSPDGQAMETRICQANGSFSDQSFNCLVQVTCPTVPSLLYGSVQPATCSLSDMPYDTSCNFICDKGYELEGHSRIECTDAGTWSDHRTITCNDVETPTFTNDCPQHINRVADRGQTTWTGQVTEPDARDNSGYVTYTRVNYASSSMSEFSEGKTTIIFMVSDANENSLTCTVNIHVLVLRCNPLSPPRGGEVNTCNNVFGSTCTISCKDGYDLYGPNVRTCEQSSDNSTYWSGMDTVCTIRTCPVVDQPHNAMQSDCGGAADNLQTFGAVCSFYCRYGFNPLGKNTVRCQADGTWTESSFECQAVSCPILIAPDEGDVLPTDCTDNPSFGQQCIFSCHRPGFIISPVNVFYGVSCRLDGEWSTETTNAACIDNTRPEFLSCPPVGAITFYTNPNDHMARINWNLTASDNDENSSIIITCDPEEGFVPVGHYFVSCVARDQSGNENRCSFEITVEDRVCPIVLPPFGGSFIGTCSNIEGSICTVTCDTGFQLIGPKEAVCQFDTSQGTEWTPNFKPICEAITCEILTELDDHISFTPFFCTEAVAPIAGAECQISCTDFYTLYPADVPNYVECLVTGNWSLDVQQTFNCSDDQPPYIVYYPPPITVTRTDVTNPVSVYFDLPRAQDNSNEVLEPQLSPPVTSPFDISHDTKISSVFKDSSGNRAVCEFNINVIDDVEPVIVRQCPPNQDIILERIMVDASWVEPTFEDPGGKYIIVSSNFRPPTKLSVGRCTVKYTGTNEITRRHTSCQFEINVILMSCPPLPAPANGIVACQESSVGQICTITCVRGSRILPGLPKKYICETNGMWIPSDISGCGLQRNPRGATLKMQVSYGTEHCSTAGKAPEIATAYLNQLLMMPGYSDYCSSSGGCSIGNSKVTCGPQSSRGRRYATMLGEDREKRQADIAQLMAWTFEFDIDVDVSTSENVTYVSPIVLLDAYANNIANYLPRVVAFPPSVEGNASFIPDSVNIEGIELICGPGFISDYNSSVCVGCVAGTFFNAETNTCSHCPIGSYQHEEHLSFCNLCPNGTSTDGEGTKSIDECYDMCPVGTSSADGLFSCAMCDIGLYQPYSGQTSCLSCPFGQITSTVGATDVIYCADPCLAGTMSSNGLAPCVPCGPRYYQPNTGQPLCLLCSGSRTTTIEGSTSLTQCIDVDNSFEELCQNGGTCIDLIVGYLCKCSPGFEGQQCDINIDECQPEPRCINRGTCVDGINAFQCICQDGFTGKDCSVNINQCDAEPCLNGGECQHGYGSFICYCSSEYHGNLCETEIDPCESNPCQYGGTCVKDDHLYVCICNEGYTGKNCNQTNSVCHRRSCAHGECVEMEGELQCHCYHGYTGDHCEVEINFCFEYVCENGGTCIQPTTLGGAICICPVEFAGIRCDHNRTICDDETCENGASCMVLEVVGQRNDFICECLDGFSGRHCEINIDECVSMPCNVQARCRDRINGYICDYPAGYKVIRCPQLPSPVNGILACYASSQGQLCVTICLSRSQQLYGVPIIFVCNTKGTWAPARVNDCDPPTRTSFRSILEPISQDIDDCSRAGRSTQMAAVYLDHLMETTFPQLCSNHDGCSLENIEVTCGSQSTRM